jgi:uncharacterized damage-inducible protein DinB
MLDVVCLMWDYNYWGHHKMWDWVMAISEEDFRRPVDYSLGSVHAQVVHVMWAEDLWFSRIHQLPLPTYTPDDFPTRDVIRAHWDGVEQRWRKYLVQLTPEDLTRTYEYTTSSGETFSRVLGHNLLHIVNHGTDHRAQIFRLLHDYGVNTDAQDFEYYLREAQI